MKVVNGAGSDDKSGKGFIAGGNDAFYKEIIADLLSNANWVVDEIAQVESLIDFAANVLRYSQPKVESMVDVRWWKSQSTSDRKVPVLVKWKNAKTGKHAGGANSSEGSEKDGGVVSRFSELGNCKCGSWSVARVN